MKSNQDKCHLLVSVYKQENVWAQIEDKIVWESNKQKLIGFQIGRNLSFNECVIWLFKKMAKNSQTLQDYQFSRDIIKRTVLMNSFISHSLVIVL